MLMLKNHAVVVGRLLRIPMRHAEVTDVRTVESVVWIRSRGYYRLPCTASRLCGTRHCDMTDAQVPVRCHGNQDLAQARQTGAWRDRGGGRICRSQSRSVRKKHTRGDRAVHHIHPSRGTRHRRDSCSPAPRVGRSARIRVSDDGVRFTILFIVCFALPGRGCRSGPGTVRWSGRSRAAPARSPRSWASRALS